MTFTSHTRVYNALDNVASNMCRTPRGGGGSGGGGRGGRRGGGRESRPQRKEATPTPHEAGRALHMCPLHLEYSHHEHEWPDLGGGAARVYSRGLIGRFRYIAWVKCPYRVAGKASALRAGKRAPG
jgi:hypothetical protein